MSNLSHYYAGSSTSSANNNNPPSPPEHSLGSGATPIDGYVSDGLVHTSNNARERKKGTNLPTHSSSSSSSHFLSVWPAGALSVIDEFFSLHFAVSRSTTERVRLDLYYAVDNIFCGNFGSI
jgi:hypothetical protein